MKTTFYDFRNTNFKNPHEFPLKGVSLLSYKKKQIVYLENIGFVVAPIGKYLFNIYFPKNIIDLIKNLYKDVN